MAACRRTLWPGRKTLLLVTSTITLATPASSLHWTPCSSISALGCTTLTVPLEYADSHDGRFATIPLARVLRNRLPLEWGRFQHSNIAGGYYDIVSWDPRGVGAATPLLACWDTAGQEAEASDSVFAAAEIEYSLSLNKRYTAPGGEYENAIREYDASLAKIAADCVEHDSSALYTSSAAYVVRDMAAIVDALDGGNALVNYWGFSYGTIYGAEFIQTFPERVGRFVFDGVFSPEANADRYTSQLPNDQLYVAEAIADLANLCEEAGGRACALAGATASANERPGPRNSSADIPRRLADLQASLYDNPVAVLDGSWSITVGMFSFFIYSFLKLTTAWPAAVSPRRHLTLAAQIQDPWPAGRFNARDNAPSNNTGIPEVTDLVLDISLRERTPWLNADLSTLSFCRNFPNARPCVPNLGASRLTNLQTNAALTARDTSVLIVNGLHDPMTPVTSAQSLHRWLSTSSQLVTRKGPGHTTISLASLGLVQAIREYLVHGTVPESVQVHDVSQAVFSEEINAGTITPEPVFDGTYTEEESRLLRQRMACIRRL
ncbi:hypothetical protein BDW66DRAFT_153661 [Aspergillus desertorum]